MENVVDDDDDDYDARRRRHTVHCVLCLFDRSFGIDQKEIKFHTSKQKKN